MKRDARIGAMRAAVLAAATAPVLAAILAALLASCGARAEPETRRLPAFASTCVVTLYDHASDAAFEEVSARFRGLDAALSMWKPGSELDRASAAAGQGPRPASQDLVELLRRGLELAALTEGRYDPTVGPLVRLWGVGTGRDRVPAPGEIQAALGLVGFRDAAADPAAGTVELKRPGMALDFGSLAKGEAAVQAGRLLAARGVRAAVVDVGGSVLVLGSKPGGKPWRVGVQRPGSARGEILGFVEVRDAVVNTSGVYERWFESGGRKWSHALDARTGWPADSGLVSATVVRGREASADGPSLALLLLGAEEGLALADRLGLAAILVDGERRVHLSRAARPLFTLTDPAYSLAAPQDP